MAQALGSLPMMAKPEAVRRKTAEEKAYMAAAAEIEQMRRESAKYETPDDYAKYGKI